MRQPDARVVPHDQQRHAPAERAASSADVVVGIRLLRGLDLLGLRIERDLQLGLYMEHMLLQFQLL
jgi:hypothetical protein